MRKLKVWIVGTRGIPGLQGGIEKRIERECSKILSNEVEFTVVNRHCYFKNIYMKNWKGINLLYLWAPRNKYLEAPIHTLIAIFLARLYSLDVLHIQAIGPGIFTPLAKILGLKVVVTHHGPDYLRDKWKGFAKIVLRLGEYFTVRFADKVIVVSEYIKNYLEKKYKREDLITIPNGVDLPEILPPSETLERFKLTPKKYILTVCRFVPEKGLHDLILVYKKIHNPQFKLVIVGDADHETNYSKNLKKLAQTIPGVVLTGVLTGRPLQELYSNAGLFVLPSYYEGLPLALLEALSYGLPVLVSDIPAHKEIPLPTYRYFSVGNREQLKQKIVELYNNGISDEEKEFILKYLRESHNWDTIAKRMLGVYKELGNL